MLCRTPCRTPRGRFGEPEEVGRAALFLASEDSRTITGQTIDPDGGRLAPNDTVPVKEGYEPGSQCRT